MMSKQRALSDLLSGSSMLALSFALVPAAYAQTAPTQTAQAPVVEEVVVTGSRLTSGFETPTPVTVVTSENLQAAAPNNIADALQQLPALAATALSTTPATAATGGANGQSLLNLRGLGTNRNLVLLDGRRVIATNTNNSVDLNVLPQNLVSRVDVVTGGASAAYGSDAVAGVTNLVLNSRFQGLKGEVGGGLSRHGDLGNRKASLAWGDAFADGRLRVIASFQYAKEDGVGANESTGRKWFDVANALIPKVPAGTPTNIIVPDVRSSIGSDGGLITNTILKGTQFLAGGTPAPFNYGFNSGAGFQSGGDGSRVNIGFAPDQWRTANFGHAEFDLAENMTFYAEGAYSFAMSDSGNQVSAETGAQFAYTIFSGNPYIPAQTQAAMTANKITSFTLGRYLQEYPLVHIINKTRVIRESFGLKGDSFLGADNWHYDISYSIGHTHQFLPETNLPNARPMYAAADAVVHPTTGQIVCRSQFYNTAGVFVAAGTGMDPGCKPINVIGINSVTPSTIAYTIGDSWKKLYLSQHVAQANLSGDLGEHFQLDGGPISVATGVEYRSESANQMTDALSPTSIDFTGVRGGPASLAGKQGPYRFFNPLPFSGDYNVKEGFAELGIPITKDRSMARALNANLAIRRTEYSLSGGVTTWKTGLDYQMIDDLRFRGTVSRDIRAPNLLELFNSATQNSNNQLYPSSSNGVTTPALVIASGNPALKPERALTKTYGVILTPTFMPGLSLSADYYNIKIDGAIGTVSAQQTLDNCYAGLTQFCSQFSFANGTVKVFTSNLNLNVLQNAGFDFEASYKTQLFDNPLTLHVLANHQTKNFSQAPNAPVISTLGADTAPRWRVTAQAQYAIDGFNFFVQERYIAPSLMDATKVEGVYTNNNHIPAVYYTDMTVTYKLEAFGSSNELYLTVNNLFDRDPPTDVSPPTSFAQPTNRTVYDGIGQYFNFGIRFKF